MAEYLNKIVRPNPIAEAIYTTPCGVPIDNPAGRGIEVYVNVSAITGTLAIYIDAQDPTSHQWYNLLTSAAINATTGGVPIVLTVYPGITPVANVAVSRPAPRALRIRALPSGNQAIWYSVGAVLLV